MESSYPVPPLVCKLQPDFQAIPYLGSVNTAVLPLKAFVPSSL
jgi:hypothetical protein